MRLDVKAYCLHITCRISWFMHFHDIQIPLFRHSLRFSHLFVQYAMFGVANARNSSCPKTEVKQKRRMLKGWWVGLEGKRSTGHEIRRAMQREEDERSKVGERERERETKETMYNEATLEHIIDRFNWNMSVKTYTIWHTQILTEKHEKKMRFHSAFSIR